MYRNIIWDIDGTLLDSEQAVTASLHQAILELEGRDLTVKELQLSLGIPGANALSILNVKWKEETMARWDALYQEYFPKTSKLFPGITELLDTLRGMGVTMGIVTSKQLKEKEADFPVVGLSDSYFNLIVVSEDTNEHKPQPEPVFCYLNKTRLNPRDCLYVGDTIHDYQCASGAGVDFALAQWGASDTSGFTPQYILQNPQDLLKLVVPSKI